MKVSCINLPTVPENNIVPDAIRQQSPANETIVHAGDIVASIHAARIQHVLRSAPIYTHQATPAQSPAAIVHPPQENKFKAAFNTLSNLCGIAAVPSIACVAFGVIYLVVPAALVVACVVFALLAGKPSEREQARREERQAACANFDYRGSV